jgi:hypothetical protein
MITGLPLSCTFLVHDSWEQCEWCSNRNYPKSSGSIHFKDNLDHHRSSQWLKGLLNRQGSDLLQHRNADPVFSDIWTLASLTTILRCVIRNIRCYCSVFSARNLQSHDDVLWPPCVRSGRCGMGIVPRTLLQHIRSLLFPWWHLSLQPVWDSNQCWWVN